MRLKSAIWVAAYLRRCQTAGVFGAVRRRGAEEAGAVFVKVATLDGNAMLYVPAPQTVYDDSRPIERWRSASIPTPGSSRPKTGQAGISSIWLPPRARVCSERNWTCKAYSIVSSARAMTVGLSSMPSAFAVFKFTTR
jgi:hypothetical protein